MFHGRAGGHNVLPFLEFFNNSEEHELTFIYSNDRTFYPENNRIRFEKFLFSPGHFLKIRKIIQSDYDLIWYHGGHSALILYIFSKLRSKKATFIFNVWNEWLIQKAKKGGLKAKMFQYGIKQADVVHCNWHGTAEVLEQTGWSNNIKVFYWGLQRQNFENHTKPEKQETTDFIVSLPDSKTKFFFPKSISPNSRHDLVIHAAYMLLQDGLTQFKVFLWLGNTNDTELLKIYQNQIDELGLQEHVILQKHGFLPFGDMQLIWKAMDVGLQIAANEQLSTTFLEPQFYKKEIIVTDIRPYRIYNQKFDSNIPLQPLESESIYRKMKAFITGDTSSKELLEKRHQIVKSNFNFSENIAKILKHYSQKLT